MPLNRRVSHDGFGIEFYQVQKLWNRILGSHLPKQVDGINTAFKTHPLVFQCFSCIPDD